MRDSKDPMLGAARLRFAKQLEPLFLEDYYNKSIGLSRVALLCSTLIFVAFGFLDPYAIPSATKQVWMLRYGVVFPTLMLAIAISFLPVYRKIMQPTLSIILMVTGFGVVGMTTLAKPDELGYLLYPMGLLLVPMVGYSFVRLRFWYATIPNLINSVVYVGAAIGYQHVLATQRGVASIISQVFFIVAMNIVGMATCYSLELYARRAFAANYLLEQERAGEQRQRERTEAMLQVLSQAIGGVIHDLGSPLTSVQVGAQTLDLYLDSGNSSTLELKELTNIINRGAEMLNHLRLSLMEQTRVLEGKPIPISPVRTTVGHLVEASVAFQKPRFLEERSLVWGGEETEVEADAMKMTTVWMNLIGNALKYSDGEVRVGWQTQDDWVLVWVGDQGQNGRGLTREQAEQLFVAFGRLDSHLSIEGTGLGLLSVRRVVEAHGGEVFIEGMSEDAHFSTALGSFSRVLEDDIATAFVVAFPAKTSAAHQNGAAPA